jgi:hypothetical protein
MFVGRLAVGELDQLASSAPPRVRNLQHHVAEHLEQVVVVLVCEATISSLWPSPACVSTPLSVPLLTSAAESLPAVSA